MSSHGGEEYRALVDADARELAHSDNSWCDSGQQHKDSSMPTQASSSSLFHPCAHAKNDSQHNPKLPEALAFELPSQWKLIRAWGFSIGALIVRMRFQDF